MIGSFFSSDLEVISAGGGTAWPAAASFYLGASRPVLTLTVNPSSPSIPSTTPRGTIVAKLTGSWSNGRSFIGNFTFGPPYWDDPPAHVAGSGAGIYAITQPGGAGSVGNLIVNPNGAGVGGAGGTIEDVTVVANDPPLPQVAGFGLGGGIAASTGVVHPGAHAWPGSASLRIAANLGAPVASLTYWIADNLVGTGRFGLSREVGLIFGF